MVFQPQKPPFAPIWLAKCGYVPVRNDATRDGLWVVQGRRQALYGKSSLPLTERLAAAKSMCSMHSMHSMH
jgi:hypothetical protein